MTGQATTVDVSAGSILAYRLFDVAYAIDLGKAEKTWARTVRTVSSRGRRTPPPPNPPVARATDHHTTEGDRIRCTPRRPRHGNPRVTAARGPASGHRHR